MKIASVPKKRRRDLIIIAILLVGLPILIFGSYQVYQLIVRASAEAQPKNVALSNLHTSSVTISWTTEVSATGSVVVVLNNEEQSPVLDRRGSGRRNTHYVDLENLEPNTQYQFTIISDNQKYTNEGGNNFEFKTAPITADTATANLVHGSVSGASGDDVVLFAFLKDKSAYPVSAIMPRGGSWMVDMAGLRSVSDKSIVMVEPRTNIVLVAITGTNEGAVVEGEYNDLIDSNGRLKDVYPLNVASNTALYSYFPAVSVLGQHFDTTQVPTTTQTQPSFPLEDEFETDQGYIADQDFGRRYGLVHDLEWIDMVVAQGTGVSGESSVKIANITDTEFSVIWVSEEKEQGYINYGTSANSLTLEANDERDGITTRNPYYVHMVSLSRLLPEVDYFFEIKSGNNTFDNGGSKYTVKTFPALSSSSPFDSISGNVEGIPEHNEAVVIAQIKDEDGVGSQGVSSKIATTVDESGRWMLSIADSRKDDGLSYFEYTSGDSIYIDVHTTVESSTHRESMQGISQRDIEISMEVNEAVGVTEVDFLDNYGILGYSSGVRLRSADVNEGYTIEGEVEIPKTGLFDSPFLVSVLIFTLVIAISLVYISKMTKRCKKGKMKNNI
jgi:hypothetical protein